MLLGERSDYLPGLPSIATLVGVSAQFAVAASEVDPAKRYPEHEASSPAHRTSPEGRAVRRSSPTVAPGMGSRRGARLVD